MGLFVLALGLENPRQRAVAVGDVVVSVGAVVVADLKCLLTDRLGRCKFTLVDEVVSEIIEQFSGEESVGVVQSAHDLQRVFVERLGLGVLPLGVEVRRQVVASVGSLVVVFRVDAAADLQRLSVAWFSLGVLALGVEVCCQVAVKRGGGGVIDGR